jgi:hypothetical protein
MLEFFYNSKDKGAITDTALIGKNLFNKNPSNREVFEAYFDFLCEMAEYESLSDRLSFFQQAEIALTFYSENAELDEKSLEAIKLAQTRLDGIYNSMVDIENSKAAEVQTMFISETKQQLAKFYRLKDRLRTATLQVDFDTIMEEIGGLDAGIDHERLTGELKKEYDVVNSLEK